MAVLEVLISAGQSNGAGSYADTLSTAQVSGAVMLNAIAQEGGAAYNNEFESGGIIDGTCILWNRLVEASEYTALIPLQNETRERLWRPVLPGTAFGVSPTYDASSESHPAGESIYPGLVAYLRARNPTQDYACLSIAHPGTGVGALKAAAGDLLANATTAFGKLHDLAITAGYTGTVVKMIAMQHGEADKSLATYAADCETYRAALKTMIIAKNSQSFDPYMVHLQCNRVDASVSANQMVAATRTYAKHGMIGSAHYLQYVSSSDLHRNGHGQRLTGSLFGRWYDRVITQGVAQRGLRFLSAVRNGDYIIVTMDPAWSYVPSLRFKETTEVPILADKGFQYTDSGSTPTITGVSVISDTQVKVQLSGIPTGTSQTLKYGQDVSSGTFSLRGLGNLVDSCADVGANSEVLENWAVRDSLTVYAIDRLNPRRNKARPSRFVRA